MISTLASVGASVALLTSPVDAAAPQRCAPRPFIAGGAARVLPADDVLTVGSLNMAADARTADSLEEWARQRSIDVLLLQEVGDDGLNGDRLLGALSERLGFTFVYAPANILDEGATEGLAIVSRFPLDDVAVHPLPYHDLPFRSRCRVALGATVSTATGPVRLVNVHLDTRINSATRLDQLTRAMGVFGEFEGPRILGGDFNTMDIGWVGSMLPLFYLQQQAKAVRTWLSSRGFDTPFKDTPPTLSFPVLPMRVDWLFMKALGARAWGVDNVRFSDHRGIWMDVGRE